MKDLKTLINMIHHLMIILNTKQRLKMLAMTFVILIGSLLELLGVSAMLPFIQGILSPEDLVSKPYIKFMIQTLGITGNNSILIGVGFGIILIYLIKNLYLSLSSYLQISYSCNLERELSVQTLKSFMDRPYSFFVDNGSGVVIRGVIDDTYSVFWVVLTLFRFLAEGFVIIAISVYLFTTDPILACGVIIVALIAVILIVFGVKKMLSRLSNIYRDAREQLGRWLVQINSGIKDIMVYNRREMFLEKFDSAYEKSNTAKIKSTYAESVPERVIEAVCISGIIVMVLIRLKMGVNANDFVPKLAAFAMGAFRLLPSISRVAGYISTFIYNRPMVEATYENIVAARNYVDGIRSEIDAKSDNGSLGFTTRINIDKLKWKYPQGKHNVLEGLNLYVNKGEAIGIVGESGSGKSTLADLLLMLYRPQEGGIDMDGIDITTIPNTWSKTIAYVPQNVFLMDDTIRENISFGTDIVSDKDIWNVLKKASLDSFVMNLPNKLDTVVGERGVKFSGGQRQRIAIARALFTNPEILILDEATSALDNETEEAVMEAIDSLAGSMTLIIIAHRVTTLRNCDRIYEIVDGKAVERPKNAVINL